MRITESSKPRRALNRLGQLFLIALLAMFCTLMGACATGQIGTGRAFHSLNFDWRYHTPGTEILDYKYGNSGEYGLQANPKEVAAGKRISGINITGNLPVGEFFYVKWQNKTTGEVFEDRVDLKSRVPVSMDRQDMYPIIEGSQLYIYLVSFDPVRPYFSQEESAALSALRTTPREKMFLLKGRYRVLEIYPDYRVDPHLPPEFIKKSGS
jgi:hypothetical protein